MAEAAAETKSSIDLAGITARIEALVRAGQVGQVEAVAAEFTQSCPAEAERLLVEGVVGFLKGQYAEVVAKFGRAKSLLAQEDHPALTSIYSNALVQSQLALPRREQPGVALGYEYYKKNIAALREVDADLAAEVQGSLWPDGLVLVELWDGLYLYGAQQALLAMDADVERVLSEQVGGRAAFGFGRIGSGREIRYALDHQVNLLHGMARAHYLFEPNAEFIRALLYMFDLSRALRECWLMIFGGTRMAARVEEVFGALRYPLPHVAAGDTKFVEDQMKRIEKILVRGNPIDAAKAYYASDEFRARQQEIAEGKVLPRVLIDTARWTTFLKYCAADFDKAFAGLGCETRFLIEENDVQHLSANLHWREVNEFRPDMFFMVTHARPSLPYLPRELPFIGYIQDKFGPILQLDDLSEHITRQDLFVGMMEEFKHYLLAKRVPPEQVFVMPIPADETMFFPLEADDRDAARFTVDVAYVKHGHGETKQVYEEFTQQYFGNVNDAGVKQLLEGMFARLYKDSCRNVEQCVYEKEMHEFVDAKLPAGAGDDLRRYVHQLVYSFYVSVYSAAWRFQFLEALDGAGIELALYGNGWTDNAKLAHLSRGPVERDRRLNHVYNFSRINLSIVQTATMHQRLSECGLAGGFMMVADHNSHNDWEPARKYYQEDEEVVFFDNADDLVEKCRYYLTNEDARREIAGRMHERARKERTCRLGAEMILRHWRDLLVR